MNEDYLKGLTPQQYIAATEIDGPMMVIAGPGTGKTQVLSARIAHILNTASVDPQNILVLTFTDSGTVAVRKRLQSMIGNTAYYVNIFTFHSFAQSIIDQHREYFSHLGTEVITDIDQITLFRNILEELPLQRLKLIDDPYFYLSDIRFAISSLKREAVTPEDLESTTLEEIEFVKNDPKNFNKRTNKLKVDASTRIDRLTKTLDLVKVYDEYQKRLKLSRRHDFDDMIINVLNTVKTNDDLRADLQEKYLYILVDEYQDTNGAQNQIVEQIASSEYFDNPNLFVVGDDDQSIYRFQGASLANIMYFKKKYPETRVVLMTQSHRSTQKILDTAQNVISKNSQRLVNTMKDIDKNLISHIEKDDSEIIIADFEHMRYEYLWIVKEIKNLKEKGYKYSDISILLRNNYEVNEFSQLLLSHDIPITSDKSSNILDDSDIRNLITLIRAINTPHDDRLYYSAMSQKWSGVSSIDRMKFTELRSQKKRSFFDLSQDMDLLRSKRLGFVETTDAPKLDTKMNNAKHSAFTGEFALFAESIEGDDENNSILNFTKFLIEHNGKLNNEPFLIFLDRLIKEIKFTDYLLSDSERIVKLNRLSTVFDYVKGKTLSDHEYSFNDFMNYIDIVESYNLTLSEKTLDLNSDSVKIMTAHKSKGLEYPIVFIPKCIDKYWGNNGSRQNITLPEGIVKNQKLSKDEKNEEERRLFFVALTRAKIRIYSTYANKYENAYGLKETNQSMFISEMGDSIPKFLHPEVVLTEDDIERELRIKNDNTELQDEFEEDFLKMTVVNFKLNATALNNYLTCPRKFLYSNLLHIPSLKSDRQSFGTAMHRALELYYNEFIRTNNLPSLDFLNERFDEAFNRETISAENKDILYKNGIEGLEGYYKNIILDKINYQKVISTEINFDKRNVYINDIQLTGKIDAVAIDLSEDNPHSIVIDYKTGRPKSRSQIEKFTRGENGEMIPSGYYSQLMFYKILTDQDKTWKYKTDTGVLDFIEGKDGKYKQEAFEYKDDELTVFKDMITETVGQIRDLKFNRIKKGKTCKECAFYKICWGG